MTESALPVDVIVVTWNSRDMVLTCLDHVAPEAVERVIVVDNASTDGTADAVRLRHPDVDIVQLARQESLAGSYNRGSERGSASLLLFLNDDVLVRREALALLVAALVDRPGAVAAAARLVDPTDGATQAEYLPQPFPTLRSLAETLVGRNRGVRTLSESETVIVDQSPGACLMVRREAFTAVGGWDEKFEFWYEDVDLAWRLRRVGDVLYVPAAAVAHVGGHSAGRLSRAQVVARHYRGALLYAHKHFGRPAQVASGLLYALAAATRLLLLPGAEARRAYGRVFRNGLRVAAGRSPLPP